MSEIQVLKSKFTSFLELNLGIIWLGFFYMFYTIFQRMDFIVKKLAVRHCADFYYSTVESFEFIEVNFLGLTNFQRFQRILFQFNVLWMTYYFFGDVTSGWGLP